MFEGVPHFGSLRVWCNVSGLGRSYSLELIEAGVLPTVEIENRRWIDVWAGLRLLHEAAETKTPVGIPSALRQAELARKRGLREDKRAAARALRPRRRRGVPRGSARGEENPTP